MATKEQLRDEYIGKGYEVAPVNTWNATSRVGDVQKYDVAVITPDGRWPTAFVAVKDDGGPNEEATPIDMREATERPETFAEAARTWLRTQEEGAPTIFALAVDKLYEHDEVLLATAYMTDNTAKQYVAKRRDGMFSFQETA